MEEITVIPFTAWEQAVFVVLVILIIVILQRFYGRQQGEWQKFISQRDQQWQEFLASQREVDQKRYEGVETTLSNLVNASQGMAKEIQELASDFQAHDAMEREIFSKPRAKRSKS